MITLYSYPELFGVADNNGYGLKVFAFMRLAGVPFRHEHIFDASKAPRGQLPYIVDGSELVGDSEAIVAYLTKSYAITIDSGLNATQRNQNLLVTRMLDDLYWVMSYSRWKDERYYPAFRDALLREHPSLDEAGLLKAKEFNAQRYYYAGIGRYTPEAAYARGLADLAVLAELIPAEWLYVRLATDQHRRGHLWLHRQYLVFRYRYAAQAVRPRACQPGASLHGDSSDGDAGTVTPIS